MQNNKSKVFILNYLEDHNYDAAKKFGELKIVTRGNINIFDIPRLKINIKDTLTVMGFKSSRDYLLLSGGNIIGFSLGLILSKLEIDKCKILLWNAKACEYFDREIKI